MRFLGDYEMINFLVNIALLCFCLFIRDYRWLNVNVGYFQALQELLNAVISVLSK